MNRRRVAWISDFPIEWLPDAPAEIRQLPALHPTTWKRVLWNEMEKDPAWEVHVCALRKHISRNYKFQVGRTTFHVCRVPGGLRAPSLFWLDTLVLRRLLRTIQPDLVHAWGTERGEAAVASRLPYPYVVTIQGLLSWYQERVLLARYEKFAAWVEKWSLRRARVLTTESRFAVEYLQQRYPTAEVHQAEHAPNHIFQEVERRPQLKPFRLLCVGTLDYRKGSDLLLRALAELLDEFEFELIIVGSPNESLLSPLRAELPPRLWSQVRFLTQLQPSEVAAELASAALLVLPTRADTSPNAVKEAVVAGVPVVASDIGGIPDYVFPDRNGLLFQAGDLRGLAETLRSAVRHPLFGRGLVEEESLRRNREYLSPERMHDLFVAAYQATLQRFQ